MCGIVGISYGADGPAAELWTPSEWLQLMLPASVHRGPHAYGWMYLNTEGDVYYQKFEGRSDTAAAIKTMEVPENLVWLVAHVRYATTGSPKVMINNHPIRHGNIMGVHNGVVRNHHSILAITGRYDDTAEVDSEAIFAAVSKWGHRRGLGRINADMVAVYANLESHTDVLHIARSHSRPLVFQRTDGGSLMFASEENILDSCGIGVGKKSPLSTHRLVRVRGGKIIERIDLLKFFQEHAYKVPSQWRKFEGADELDEDEHARAMGIPPFSLRQNRYRNPLAEEQARQAAQAMRDAQERSEPPKTKKKSKAQRGYSRVQSSHFKDGERVGTKIYYQGLLLSDEEYAEEMGY